MKLNFYQVTQSRIKPKGFLFFGYKDRKICVRLHKAIVIKPISSLHPHSTLVRTHTQKPPPGCCLHFAKKKLAVMF